ncbi:MAG: Stk1 family PASTA domain-containing Ser/Thr kinase, partial [Nocardioides sp.]
MNPDQALAGRARGADGGAADPLNGLLLDERYLIVEQIARGGMATVYRANDIRLDRTVAVKVMHAGLADSEPARTAAAALGFAERFVREARAAARLSHENIVSVFDQGNDGETTYLVMEYLPGETLRDVIEREAPMPPERALALIDPVLAALAVAHRAGIVHRDVKPENVLISADGRIKVADFGLAKAIGTESHTAAAGVLIGTVSYLAPELVIDGRSDARADVYAAGVLLYEMITGEKPHGGDSPIQVAYKHVHEDVPPPSRSQHHLEQGASEILDELVARATAREADRRPADAGALLVLVQQARFALTGPRQTPDQAPDQAPVDSANRPEPTTTNTTTLAAATATVAADGRHAAPPPDDFVVTDLVSDARRSGPRVPLLIAALVALALVAGLGWWFGIGRYTSTPGVLGLTQAAAKKELGEAGLGIRVGESEFSETVPKGTVIRTEPGPGARILEAGQVTVTLSRGKERYPVPTMRGRTEDQAQDALAETRLAVGERIEQY